MYLYSTSKPVTQANYLDGIVLMSCCMCLRLCSSRVLSPFQCGFFFLKKKSVSRYDPFQGKKQSSYQVAYFMLFRGWRGKYGTKKWGLVQKTIPPGLEPGTSATGKLRSKPLIYETILWSVCLSLKLIYVLCSLQDFSDGRLNKCQDQKTTEVLIEVTTIVGGRCVKMAGNDIFADGEGHCPRWCGHGRDSD